MRTKLYRVVLVALNAIGSAVVLVQNAGDLTDPTVQTSLVVALIGIAVVAIRQIKDPTTPTRPPSTGSGA